MSKTLILNEKQYNRLFTKQPLTEAMNQGFRIDMLRGKPFSQRIRYLKQYFGDPIGKGTSRYVYQIDDYTVLKVAVNPKGIAQNEQEYRVLHDEYSPIVPKVYNGSDDTNFEWIVTDYVLPANAGDFRKLLGVPFRVIQQYCTWADRIIHPERGYDSYDKLRHQFYDDNVDNEELIEFVSAIDDLIGSYDVEAGDIARMSSWGLKNYNGEAGLVLLDVGLTDDIFKKYYKRW